MPMSKYVRYSDEVADAICRRLEAGESFYVIGEDPMLPAPATIVAWRTKHPEFGEAVKAALKSSGRVERQVKAEEKWSFYNDVIVPYEGDECIFWPFSTTGSRGYAAIHQSKGPTIYISRLVCELEHGPAPTDTHEAAHSCGKGHLGCATRSHLSWKTVQENNWDKDEHGTRIWGETHPDAKLTVPQVVEIRSRAAAGELQWRLAEEFGVAKTTMSSIVNRKTWKRVA